MLLVFRDLFSPSHTHTHTHTHTEAEQTMEERTQFKELYEAKIKVVEERDELVMQAEEERVR